MTCKTITFPWTFPGNGPIEAFNIPQLNVFAVRASDTRQVLLVDYELKYTCDTLIPKYTLNDEKTVQDALVSSVQQQPWNTSLQDYIIESSNIKKTFDLHVKFEQSRNTVTFTPIFLYQKI